MLTSEANRSERKRVYLQWRSGILQCSEVMATILRQTLFISRMRFQISFRLNCLPTFCAVSLP